MKDESAANGPANDRGFLYGDGLFETVRVERGEPRFLDRHCRRFQHSAKALDFPEQSVSKGLEALQSLTGRRDGLWRVTVTRPGMAGASEALGTIDVRWRDFPYATSVDGPGPTLTVVEGFYFPRYWLAEHKTTSWLRSLEARRQAVNEGFDEALMVSPDGQIGEAAAANVFLRIADGWVTPAIEGILPGIIREVILHRGREVGIEIEERPVYVGDLQMCESLVLTSTGRLVTAVKGVDELLFDAEPANELKALLQQ